MAKRFTDTAKWKDGWFQDLPSKYKLFWVYLLDECDASGVWKPNIRLATFQIGEPFEESELKRVFNDRIEVTESGYWFVKKFIDFQYGELSPACKPHASVISLLKNHKIKGYSKGIQTLKEKDKEKEEDQEEDNSPKEKTLGTGKHYFIVTKKHLGSTVYRIQGSDGMAAFFEINKSVINFPDWSDKFMRDRNGKAFTDFGHVWNDFQNYVKQQFK